MRLEKRESDQAVVNIAWVKIADPSQFRTAVTSKGRTNKISTIARKANAAGAYAVLNAERVEGKRVLLVDDIVTTGATLASCAGVLADAGCAAVFGAAAASRS